MAKSKDIEVVDGGSGSEALAKAREKFSEVAERARRGGSQVKETASRAKVVAKEKASRASEVAKEKAGRAGEVAKEKYGVAVDSMKQGYDKVHKDLGKLTDDVNEYVRHNPGRSVLMAAGLGFVIGLLARGRRS